MGVDSFSGWDRYAAPFQRSPDQGTCGYHSLSQFSQPSAIMHAEDQSIRPGTCLLDSSPSRCGLHSFLFFGAVGINYENENRSRWHFLGGCSQWELSRGRGKSPGQLQLLLIIMEMCANCCTAKKNKKFKLKKKSIPGDLLSTREADEAACITCG